MVSVIAKKKRSDFPVRQGEEEISGQKSSTIGIRTMRSPTNAGMCKKI